MKWKKVFSEVSLVSCARLIVLFTFAVHLNAALLSACPFGDLVPPSGGAPRKVPLNYEDRVLMVTDRVVNLAPPDVADRLIDLFDNHLAYFSEPARLDALDRRSKLLGARLFSGWNVDTVPAQNDGEAFLIAARGNIKDLVWNGAQQGRERMGALGIQPELYSNLIPPEVTRKALQSALDEELVKVSAIDNKLEIETGHRLKEFLEQRELLSIYSDEVAGVLRAELAKKQKQVSVRSKSDAVKTLMDSLAAPLSRGNLTFSLSGRDVDSLKAGNDAGDCTQCKGVNSWTNGPWTSTFENNELRVSDKGKFFARFVMIAGESDGKPALFVHAVEFNPQVRNQLAEEKLNSQKQNLQAALAFLKEHSKAAGFESVILTDISNSSDYSKIMRQTLSPHEREKQIWLPFSLLNPLTSSHETSKLISGKKESPPIRIYLQGWGSPARFPEVLNSKPTVSKREKVTIGDRSINYEDVERASHVLYQEMGTLRDQARRKFLKLRTYFDEDIASPPTIAGDIKRDDVLHDFERNRGRFIRIAKRLPESKAKQFTLGELKKMKRNLYDVFDGNSEDIDELDYKARLDESQINTAVVSNFLVGLDNMLPQNEIKPVHVAAILAGVGPKALKEQMKEKYLQMDLPKDTAEWLSNHPEDVIRFYNNLTDPEHFDGEAVSLGTRLRAYRIAL